MTKLTLSLMLLTLFVSGCVNKHGVSAKYYSECKEYYDYQGYYHKECGEDDIITYKEMGDLSEKTKDFFKKKKQEPIKNVW